MKYLIQQTDSNSACRLKNILHDEHEITPKLINNAGAPQILHCRVIDFDFCIIFTAFITNMLLSVSFKMSLD
jgi:hypothetical protein